MKNALTITLAMAVGFLAAMLWLDHRRSPPSVASSEATAPAANSHAASPDIDEVEKSPRPRRAAAATSDPEPEAPAAQPAKRTAEDLLNELASIQVTPGPGQARAQYRILGLMDQLAGLGGSALPAIRQFLASDRDVPYAVGGSGRNGRNAGLPPSLRMGLFDVVRQTGGSDSEQLLAEALTATSRAGEVAYLAQLLEESSPGKHRDATLAAARSLLAGGKIADAAERNQLYDLLLQLKDTSYVATAQANLVQPDGKLDASALRYLQQTLGEKSLPLAAQLFQDKRIADADSREALGRVALNYVGANDAALELFHQAALDPQLKPDQRRNLVEDLNQEGFSNRRNPTPEDLKIIASRYQLTQTYLQQDYVKNDKTLLAAFQEANKDLARMLERAGAAK